MNRDEFIAAVVALKAEAGQLGLWQTMHAFDAVTHAYGEEVGGYKARVVTVDQRDYARKP